MNVQGIVEQAFAKRKELIEVRAGLAAELEKVDAELDVLHRFCPGVFEYDEYEEDAADSEVVESNSLLQ